MKTHFHFNNVTDEFKMNGKSLEFVLLNQVNNGVYIATSQVHCTHKDKTYENHAFVYNSHFTQQMYPQIQGGILDNRLNSNCHGLEKKIH